jgi:hypothetical protein
MAASVLRVNPVVETRMWSALDGYFRVELRPARVERLPASLGSHHTKLE